MSGTFHRPEKIEINQDTLTKDFGEFIGQPFERGWGTTVGNSLRRILLSSIDGAAITAVRIEGALHEFTTVAGCSEDVIDLILNLKQIPMAYHGDGFATLTLDVQGPGKVTSKDLDVPGDVELFGDKMHIATINDECHLQMEIRVANGRGYVPAEENKTEDLPIGFIPVDSSHSPVKKVAYQVGNVRVGQTTDFEKLTLQLWTNGTVAPEAALGSATKLLSAHLNPFAALAGVSLESQETTVEASPTSDLDEILSKPVEELELSVRSFNCLKNANILTIKELVTKTEATMLKTKNFGRKSLDEINEVLGKMGLSLGMNV